MSVSMFKADGFHTCSVEEAERIIYNELQYWEPIGVHLSSYGNNLGADGVESYNADKGNHKLFNVEYVQQVYEAIIKLNITTSSRSSMRSFDIAEVLKNQPDVSDEEKENGKYSSGNVALSMILHGFTAHFFVKNQAKVHAEFKVVIKV